MNKNKKMLFTYIFALTIWPLIVSFLIGGFEQIIGAAFTDEQGLLATNMLVYLLLIGSTLYLFKNEIRDDMKRAGKQLVLYFFKYGFALFVLEIAMGNLISLFGTESTKNQDIINTMYSAGWIVSMIISVFFAPIVEEIIFRYIIMGDLLKNKKTISRILISALIFGALHLDRISVLAFLPYFAAGLLLGYIYAKTQSITACISAHIFNNLMCMLIRFAA